ncbi:hypothetical protein I546_6253 [Mycobacterium kansasii 732]|nr:hypothetical protein I546_6253 [Mycobacterium kansasii 732]
MSVGLRRQVAALPNGDPVGVPRLGRHRNVAAVQQGGLRTLIQ